MTIVSVTYPKHSGTHFDLDYYVHKHMQMVRTLLGTAGLQSYRLLCGKELATGGEPTYEMIALLSFANAEEFRAGMAEHGQSILDDIANFTDMKPAIQINDVIDS